MSEGDALVLRMPPADALDDRVATLDLSCDPDEVDRRFPLVEPPVFLPSLPASQGPQWWAKLAMYAPTGYLLDELDELPLEELDAEQALQAAAAAERIIARVHAVQAKAIARFAKLRPATPGEGMSMWYPDLSRYGPDELGLALGVSRHAAGRKLALAYELTERLPGTLAALHGGRTASANWLPRLRPRVIPAPRISDAPIPSLICCSARRPVAVCRPRSWCWYGKPACSASIKNPVS